MSSVPDLAARLSKICFGHYNHAHGVLPFDLCARMQGVGEKKKLHGFLGDLLRVGCVKVQAYHRHSHII